MLMIIPTLQGQFPSQPNFIFTAADTVYFDIHAKPLINSVLQNTPFCIHIHIYNPTAAQLEFCYNLQNVSVSYEHVSDNEFYVVSQEWLKKTDFENIRQKQMFDKGQQYGPVFLQSLITRTYYACTRFIRLNQLLSTTSRCLSIDVDGIVRKPFSLVLPNDKNVDLFLYEKKFNEHLAGAILFNKNSKPFLNHYASVIQSCIENNDIYWFLDQIVLDQVVQQYNKGVLPLHYIDWEMNDSSAIWTAKGKRKELSIFKAEQNKYNS